MLALTEELCSVSDFACVCVFLVSTLLSHKPLNHSSQDKICLQKALSCKSWTGPTLKSKPRTSSLWMNPFCLPEPEHSYILSSYHTGHLHPRPRKKELTQSPGPRISAWTSGKLQLRPIWQTSGRARVQTIRPFVAIRILQDAHCHQNSHKEWRKLQTNRWEVMSNATRQKKKQQIKPVLLEPNTTSYRLLPVFGWLVLAIQWSMLLEWQAIDITPYWGGDFVYGVHFRGKRTLSNSHRPGCRPTL